MPHIGDADIRSAGTLYRTCAAALDASWVENVSLTETPLLMLDIRSLRILWLSVNIRTGDQCKHTCAWPGLMTYANSSVSPFGPGHSPFDDATCYQVVCQVSSMAVIRDSLSN